MNETQTADYLFNTAISVANRKKSHSLKAAKFSALTYEEKIDFMNNCVFPKYEKAGSPEPLTEECLNFTSNLFS